MNRTSTPEKIRELQTALHAQRQPNGSFYVGPAVNGYADYLINSLSPLRGKVNDLFSSTGLLNHDAYSLNALGFHESNRYKGSVVVVAVLTPEDEFEPDPNDPLAYAKILKAHELNHIGHLLIPDSAITFFEGYADAPYDGSFEGLYPDIVYADQTHFF